MGKPSVEELEDSEKFEKVVVEVVAYRRRADGNHFFKDHDDVVLDKYVTVRDVDGVLFVSRRKSGLEGLGSKLVRGAIAVLAADRLGIPMGVARRLLNVAKQDAFLAAGIKRAVKLVDDGEKREGAQILIETVGPKVWQEILDGWYAVTGDMTVEEFRKELEEADKPF